MKRLITRDVTSRAPARERPYSKFLGRITPPYGGFFGQADLAVVGVRGFTGLPETLERWARTAQYG